MSESAAKFSALEQLQAKQIAALEAERDRLREVLRKIGDGIYCEQRDDAAVAAREALR